MTDEPVINWPNGDKSLAETIGEWAAQMRAKSTIGRELMVNRNQAGVPLNAGDWTQLAAVLNFIANELAMLLGAVTALAIEADNKADRPNPNLHDRFPFLYGS